MASTRSLASASQGEKPLSGRRIVITRARAQAAAFARAIEGLGGEVVEFPTIEIMPPESYAALDRAIRRIEKYHWIIFTSVNGVLFFFERWRKWRREIGALRELKIAAIGPETAKRLESAGLRPDLVPEEFRAEAILQAMKPAEMAGKRVLVPRAARARDVLPRTLRQWGAEVDVIAAYRTVPASDTGGRLEELLGKKEIDMVTFTSSSTVANFSLLFGREKARRLASGVAVACIGPITQKTAGELGLRVDVVSQDYTIPGLTKAIAEYFKRQ